MTLAPLSRPPADLNAFLGRKWLESITNIANGLVAQAILIDGTVVPIANIPFAGFKITGLGDATARDEALLLGQIQDGEPIYAGSSSGAANVYDLTLAPAITAYQAGMHVRARAHQENSGSITGSWNGVGAFTYKKEIGNALYSLVPGDIANNRILEIIHDGTQGVIQNPAAPHIIDRAPASVAITDSIAAETLYSKTILANTLGAYRGIRFTIHGNFQNISGANRTHTFRVAFGGTTVCSVNVVTTTGLNRGTFTLQFTLCNGGVTNAQNGQMVLITHAVAATEANSINGDSTFGNATVTTGAGYTGAKDTTADQAFAVTVQHSAAGTTCDTVGYNATLELI